MIFVSASTPLWLFFYHTLHKAKKYLVCATPATYLLDIYYDFFVKLGWPVSDFQKNVVTQTKELLCLI